VLWGGRSTVLIATLATLLTYAVGVPLGMVAGFRRDWGDGLLMRTIDVIQAFPPIILVLLIISGAGRSVPWLIAAVALVFIPGVARVVRAATIEVSVRPFVEASIARGERTTTILSREVLPNIGPVLLADVGIRFTGTVLLAASLNYLGLGVTPPASEWGLLIAENRGGLGSNPWITIAPALLIVCLTVAGNLIADAFGRVQAYETGLDREVVARWHKHRSRSKGSPSRRPGPGYR
jgi:ABC-type dipeptide/oligopeptide/nickel transport system permease subunit